MLTAEFRDYDAYTHAIQHVDASFMAHNFNTPFWRISGLALPCGITLQHCWSGSGAIARGATGSGGIELAIPAAGHFIANGEVVPDNGALLMLEGREFMVSIEGIHSWFNVFLPDPLPYTTGVLLDAAGLNRKNTGAIRNNTAQSTLVRLLSQFFMQVQASPEIAASDVSLQHFQEELLMALSAAYGFHQDHRAANRGRPARVSSKTVSIAVDVIEASPTASVSISELAVKTEVSERALRSAFHKYLGMSPNAYIQLQTMNKARQQLSLNRPESTTVARVATDLGVWDLGRFATRYRRTFGELPSETLHRQ